jgi:hypothetical protein
MSCPKEKRVLFRHELQDLAVLRFKDPGDCGDRFVHQGLRIDAREGALGQRSYRGLLFESAFEHDLPSPATRSLIEPRVLRAQRRRHRASDTTARSPAAGVIGLVA